MGPSETTRRRRRTRTRTRREREMEKKKRGNKRRMERREQWHQRVKTQRHEQKRGARSPSASTTRSTASMCFAPGACCLSFSFAAAAVLLQSGHGAFRCGWIVSFFSSNHCLQVRVSESE